MSFSPVSFFAGVGTVFVAISVGFGGGFMMTNATQKPETPNRVERVTSAAGGVPLSTQPLVQNSIAPSRIEDVSRWRK